MVEPDISFAIVVIISQTFDGNRVNVLRVTINLEIVVVVLTEVDFVCYVPLRAAIVFIHSCQGNIGWQTLAICLLCKLWFVLLFVVVIEVGC